MGHEGHSFEAVEAVLANPFPPGTDPTHVRLPAVARLRSPEDTEENHLRYWQAHLWETLLRYRRAFGAPACTDRLRAGYADVDRTAVQLAERATSGFPLSPIDSVGCHSTLKELRAGALRLEETVSALSDGAGGLPADLPGVLPTEEGAGVAAEPAGLAPEPSGVGDDPSVSAAAAAPLTQDLFMHQPPSKGFEFKLSLRGVRGMRRNRSLAVGRSAEIVPEA